MDWSSDIILVRSIPPQSLPMQICYLYLVSASWRLGELHHHGEGDNATKLMYTIRNIIF